MNFYYSKLNSIEKSYYDNILKSYQHNDSSVTVFGLYHIDYLERIVTAINYDHPELFFIDFRAISGITTPLGFTYHIKHLYNSHTITTMTEKMEQVISDIISEIKIKNDDTEINKCRKIHNYLVTHVRYNYNALTSPNEYPENFTVLGALINKEAVCEGISKAFMILCSRVGVKACLMCGVSSREGFGDNIPHAWNIVSIGTEYAHVDVTWDLGGTETSKTIRYDYFLIPDCWMQSDHKYDVQLPCLTYAYSYFGKKNKLCEGVKALRMHLDREISYQSETIYFKLISSNGFPIDINERVNTLVNKILDQYRNGSYSLQMIPNSQQNIFFYRIMV